MSANLITVTIDRQAASACKKSTLSIIETFTEKFIDAFGMLTEVGEDHLDIQAVEDPLTGAFTVVVLLVSEDKPDPTPNENLIRKAVEDNIRDEEDETHHSIFNNTTTEEIPS